MKNWSHHAVTGVLLLTLVALSGCMVSAKEMKDNITKYRGSVSGQYKSETGAKLYIAPVRARMVTDEALYIERHDPNGTIVGRLLNVEVAEDGETIILRALTFTQEGQWRNLRENPELAHLFVQRITGRDLHARGRLARGSARYFVCASSQSRTVPYH